MNKTPQINSTPYGKSYRNYIRIFVWSVFVSLLCVAICLSLCVCVCAVWVQKVLCIDGGRVIILNKLLQCLVQSTVRMASSATSGATFSMQIERSPTCVCNCSPRLICTIQMHCFCVNDSSLKSSRLSVTAGVSSCVQ